MDEGKLSQGGSPRAPGRNPSIPAGCWLWLACLMGWMALVPAAKAQTFRVGPFDFSAVGTLTVGYDSNVDGLAEDEQKEGVQRSDFYWGPGVSVVSKPVGMRPNTTIGLSGAISYMDYFVRNDLDTAVYNLSGSFQTTHPRLSLGGVASAIYAIDSSAHEYVPGGSKRDPNLVQQAGGFAGWNFRILRLEGNVGFTRERHDYEEFQSGDQDETSMSYSAYLDVSKWGSLYYTWERTRTYLLVADAETTDTTETFGFSGSIPLEILRRPQISYSFGFSHETVESPDGESKSSWEPVHTITVQDAFDLSKSVRLTAAASWVKTVADDTVTFQYNANLSQQLGPRAQHSVSFTREPRPTFGSTSDTETTSYGYNFGMRDLVFKDLSFSLSLSYDESTPLGDPTAVTEETTSVGVGLNHSRQFSRRLSRAIAYAYTWEDSNLRETGATIKHLVTYSLNYAF